MHGGAPGPGIRRLVRTALSPWSGRDLASLRRSEVALRGRVPAPMVLGVLGVDPRSGTSTLAALLGQALAALAPGHVAVLDADGIQQSQRIRLAPDESTGPQSGGLRQLVAAPEAWRSRRAIERYVTPAGGLSVLAPAAAERAPVLVNQLEIASRLLRRRYPIVVADLPVGHHPWAVNAVDHLIVVGSLAGALPGASNWIRTCRSPGRTLAVAAHLRPSTQLPPDIDVVFPPDPALTRPGPVQLAALGWPTLAAIEDLTGRVLRVSTDHDHTGVTPLLS